MFIRHGYPQDDAEVRARVLYFTPIGHYTPGITEDTAQRLTRRRAYLRVFSGVEPSESELTRFNRLAHERGKA